MATYLITGASGFLGTHLIDALQKAGHSLRACCRNPTSVVGHKNTSADGSATDSRGVVWQRVDVLDRSALRSALEGCEGVFHLAGLVSFRDSDAEELHRVHVHGTRNVVELAREVGVKRVVHCSTSGTVAVSDDPDFIADESSPEPIGLISRWPYYRAKLFAEKEALKHNGNGLEVVSVNPTLLLGPGDVNRSSTEEVQQFLDGKIPAVPPGGLSYVDARDAALGLTLAMSLGRPGERYLLGACNLTLRDYFGRLERVSGKRAPRIGLPRSPEVARAGVSFLTNVLNRVNVNLPFEPQRLDMAQFFWYLSADKAERELGWVPRDPTETLLDTVRDLQGS